MELQLELLPYHFYNTLGAELIDYIDHVDDPIVLEKIAPLSKDSGCPPIDPRVCFRCITSTLPARKSPRFESLKDN